MIRALLIAAATAGLAASPALADGGQTIAGAPAVVYGQQQFGNTANGLPESRNVGADCPLHSWWTLPVVAGDQIIIDWETNLTVANMAIFAVGTTDFNIEYHDWAALGQPPEGGGKSELKYTAPRTGPMPLLFEGIEARCGADISSGPYSFTTYVRHGVRLSLPRRASLGRQATLKIGAHSPEGGSISDPALKVTVQVRLPSGWRGVGSAPVLNSAARVKLRISRHLRGKRVALRARAQGSSYSTETSRRIRVRVR